MKVNVSVTPIIMAFSVIYGGNALATEDDAVNRALNHIQKYSQHVKKSQNDNFSAQGIKVDKNGKEHVRFDRTYKGLQVIGGDVVIHSRANGEFLSASKTLQAPINLDTQPQVTKSAAIKLAETQFAKFASRNAATEAKLTVYGRGKEPVLAWDVKVTGLKPSSTPSEHHFIIDAITQQVLDQWDDIESSAAQGTGNSFFNGSVGLISDFSRKSYALRDPSRGKQYTTDMKNSTSGSGTLFSDSDNLWGNGTLNNRQSVAVDAQYGTAVTWDYYKNVHGRLGIANNGSGSFNRVHYGVNYNNAFWSDSCFCMTYGDGDGVNFNPFDSLDVAGHEMSHGVTSRTARLIYSGESGGLNEATSDIFGTMVEFYAQNAIDTPDYTIGERLYKNGNQAIRYMYNPGLDGRSASCYFSTIGSLDVHYSSGVANHFYYLLAEGSNPSVGPISPTCDGSTITGIGRGKAEKIWYRALTVYMTSSTNYAGARLATLNAAGDLYGQGSIEQNAVANAWSAVSVN